MTKQELIDLLNAWENLDVLIKEMGANAEWFKILMDIALNNPEQRSWRAAYLADRIHDKYPALLLPYIDKMILKLKTEDNSGKKRHFLKLLSMNEIPEQHFGFLVDYCLDTLGSGKEPPAVRVHAMQVLFNISEKEPEFKPELMVIIEHEMEFHSTPGILSRGNKLVKKLHQQTRKI
jgi:hypothetical protein